MANSGGDGALITPQIWDQRGKCHARKCGKARGHFLRVRHLRHPFRMDEACCLNPGYSCEDELFDQREFVARGNGFRLILQSVARGDIDNSYFFTHKSASSKFEIVAQEPLHVLGFDSVYDL